MADFINTVDVLGDEVLTAIIIDRSISEYMDNGVIKLGDRALAGCTALNSVGLPSLTTIGQNAFADCNALESVCLPAATSIGSSAFMSCKSLISLDLSAVQQISGYIVQSALAFTTLIIRNTISVCTLSSKLGNTHTPIENGVGYIYVPRDLVESYQSATNWSIYASQFRALEDYTVDGTTAGELDPTKI